jgi:transcriptional regulator
MSAPLKPGSIAEKRRRLARAAVGESAATLVDPRPAQAHIRRLRRRGMSVTSIARAAGVSRSVISALAWPNHTCARKWITSTTEAKILAARFSDDGLPHKAKIDSLGTVRRVRALCAIGWSMTHIAGRLGATPQNVSHWIEHATVEVRTHRRIASLYAALEATPGPSNYAKKFARRRGWHPPSAWDNPDDANENPKGVTDGWIAETAGSGLDAAGVSALLGIQESHVRAALRRLELEAGREVA